MSLVDTRIETWLLSRNFVAIGNLGEQIAYRLLLSLDYLVLTTQDDLLGGVSNILGEITSNNPEDFICQAPDGRLVTVNSKATASPSGAGFDRHGDLRRPRISSRQRAVDYTSDRAELIDYPLDGDAASQVLKVDLLNEYAQLFDINDTGQLDSASSVIAIGLTIAEVLAHFQGEKIPPPSAHDD